MPALILLAFILVPIAEIAVFIEAGKFIGLGWTLAVVVATAVAGTWLLRRQGLQVLEQTQARLNRGEVPVGEMFTGICLLVAGALLLTPGFLTDSIGLLLFVPPVRNAIGHFVLKRMVQSPKTRVWVDGEEMDIGGPGKGQGQGPVIDGEFTRVPPGDESGNDKPPSGDSPWRRND
jgi:UPF0716 protein FxsA